MQHHQGVFKVGNNGENYYSDEDEEELENLTDKITVVLTNKFPGLQGFGLDISGGYDRPYFPDDHGLFVSAVKIQGLAEKSGQIHVGDKIIEVNGSNVENVTHDEAVQLFIENKSEVKLKIHKSIGLLLRAASATPTPPPHAVSPESTLASNARNNKVEERPFPSIYITGFLFGITIGCISVVLLKRYI